VLYNALHFLFHLRELQTLHTPRHRPLSKLMGARLACRRVFCVRGYLFPVPSQYPLLFFSYSQYTSLFIIVPFCLRYFTSRQDLKTRSILLSLYVSEVPTYFFRTIGVYLCFFVCKFSVNLDRHITRP